MDPQLFIRLTIGSLSLRIPGTTTNVTKPGVQTFISPAVCEIRLQGFPLQTAPIPLLSPEVTPDMHNIATSFYLDASDIQTMLTTGCFSISNPCLEISVFSSKKGSHCGIGSNRQQIGTFKLSIGPEWYQSKSSALFCGWVGIGKGKQDSEKSAHELHLRVKLDPDPRFVFRFEDKTSLSPQIVQIRKAMK